MIKLWTWGSFDVLHAMHLVLFRRCIEDAILLGQDRDFEFYVSVLTDKAVAENKKRPALFNEKERRCIISHLPYVKDAAVESYESGLASLTKCRPDYIFLGPDQNKKWDKRLERIIKENALTSEIKISNSLKIDSSTSLRESHNDYKKHIEKKIRWLVQKEINHYSDFARHLDHVFETRYYMNNNRC